MTFLFRKHYRMESIRFEVANQVATLTMDSPSNRNALGTAMRQEIAEVLKTVRHDASIRALVFTGAGGHFSAGGDIRNMAANQGMDHQAWRTRMQELHVCLHDLLTLDKPIIAAVDGYAYGAGFSMALTADFVLATPRAKFCMSFMRIGLVPDVGALHTLPRIVGVQRAKEIMLSAREVSAEEALHLGIVMELHEPDALLARAQALANSFVQASPLAVSLIKRSLAPAHGGDLPAMLDLEANIQALAGTSAEHRAGVQRFLAKEPALFQWPQN